MREATVWEKIFANLIPGKDLYVEYKSSQNPTLRKQHSSQIGKGLDISPKRTSRWQIGA